jgi:hypothetical protein
MLIKLKSNKNSMTNFLEPPFRVVPPGAGNHMQPQQPTHQQINQRLQASINQNQANQNAQNYHPNAANQPPQSNINGQGNPHQIPPKALTPQPSVVQYPPQRQQPQPGQPRPGVPYPNQQQPVNSTTPTLTSQLGPGQQPPVGQQARRPMPNQQQQPPPGVQPPYNQPPSQGNRMIQPQPGQPPFQNSGMNMPPQQRSATPDAKIIRPPGILNINYSG